MAAQKAAAFMAALLFVVLLLQKRFYLCSNENYSLYFKSGMDIVESSGICNIESCFFTSLNKTRVYFSRRSRWLFVLLLLSGDVEKCPGPNATDEIREFTNAKGMNMFHLNVRGLWANFAEISNILINNRKIDIFSLTEIHTGDEPEDMFAINGYTFIHKSRKFGKGGGVAFYVADHVIYKRRHDLEINEIEGIWLEICPKNAKSYLLSVIYRPPDNSKYLNKDFSSLLSDVLSFNIRRYQRSYNLRGP